MKAKIALAVFVLAVVAQASWRSDATTAPIPTTPAKGILLGQSFMPVVVKLKKSGVNSVSESGKVKDRAQNWILTFAGDASFIPDQDLQIWINTDLGTSISDRTFVMKPYAFGTDEARKQSYGSHQGSRVPRGVTSIFATVKPAGKQFVNEIFSDKFSLRLVFGKPSGGMIPGKIYATLPDKHKSFLAGTFRARIEK
ncbi:MAG: hypothetical protein H7Y17_10000 [Chlorobia bacterium]|nr:hypothetical protein [Fimbriimonadaceae bacterium]